MNDPKKSIAPRGKKRFRVLALADNVPLKTALANDAEYADIFVAPLRYLACAGNALITISGSGNSLNVIRALRYWIGRFPAMTVRAVRVS